VCRGATALEVPFKSPGPEICNGSASALIGPTGVALAEQGRQGD
jgi:hypothetical protein